MNFKAVASLCLVVAVQVAFGTLTVTDYASEKRATVDVDAGEADSSLYLNGDRATWKIQKIGAGEVKILADSKYFSGTIEVLEGTLNSRGEYGNKAFGKPSAVTVSPGATIKFTGSIGGYFHEKGTVLTIAGTGANDIGALYADNSSTAAQLASLTLSADSLINAATAASKLTFNGVLNSSFRTFNLGPYVLTTTGPGRTGFYGGTMAASGSGGISATGGLLDLSLTSGNRLSLTGGSANELKISNGATVRLGGIADNAPWTMKFDGSTTSILSNNTANVWAGPLVVNGPAAFWDAATSDEITFSGPVTSTASLTKRGSGKVVFTGNDAKTFGGNLNVNGGRVEFNGTKNVTLNGTENSVQGGNSVLAFVDAGVVTNGSSYGLKVFGTSAGQASKLLITGNTVFPQTDRSIGEKSSYGSDYRYSIVELGAGAVVSNALSIGEDGYEIGSVYHRGGEWTLPSGSGNLNGRAPIANAAQAFYELSGGKFSTYGGTASITIGNGPVAQGLVSVFGGTFLSGPVSFAGNAYGNWYQTNGTARVSGGNDFGLRMAYGSGSHAEMTLAGANATITIAGGTHGTDFVVGPASGSSTAVLNLNDGGTLAYNKLYKADNNDAKLYLNFNGGVLKPGNCWQAIGQDDLSSGKTTAIKKPTAVTLYEKGLVIDISEALNGSNPPKPDTTFIDCDLTAPVGGGIVSITPPNLSSVRYIHAPRVHIIGDGEGASAVAVFDSASCRVTGIKVTSPGFGYTQANTTCRIEGNSYQKTLADRIADGNSYACTITVGAVKGGGLRMRGAGNRLNLSGSNTYAGVTVCETGSIKFVSAAAHPNGGGLEVWKGADIKFPDGNGSYQVGSLAGNGTVSQASLAGITNVTVAADALFAAEPSPLNVVDGSVALADGAKVTVTGLRELVDAAGGVDAFVQTIRSRPVLTAKDGVLASNVSVDLPGLTADEAISFKAFVAPGGALKFGRNLGMSILIR